MSMSGLFFAIHLAIPVVRQVADSAGPEAEKAREALAALEACMPKKVCRFPRGHDTAFTELINLAVMLLDYDPDNRGIRNSLVAEAQLYGMSTAQADVWAACAIAAARHQLGWFGGSHDEHE